MKTYILCCLFLLLTLPAFATVTPVQSNAKWNCSALTGQSVTCTVGTTTAITIHNLLVVWTFWESSNGSGGTYPYTAGVDDSGTGGGNNTWYSAAGPTLQLAATTPTTAQIFYAKNINSTTGADPIRITFSCPYSAGPPPSGKAACTAASKLSIPGLAGTGGTSGIGSKGVNT